MEDRTPRAVDEDVFVPALACNNILSCVLPVPAPIPEVLSFEDFPDSEACLSSPYPWPLSESESEVVSALFSTDTRAAAINSRRDNLGAETTPTIDGSVFF